MEHQNNAAEEDSFIILGTSSPKNSIETALMESKIMECSKSSKGSNNTATTSNGSTGNVFENGKLFASYSEYADELDSDFQPLMERSQNGCQSDMFNSTVSGMGFPADIEYKIADLVKENTVLKHTLAKNNMQMKEQFKNIAKWQEDMMNTHKLHKVKFGETKMLIEKLRMEKSDLKKKLDHECEVNMEYRSQIDSMAIKLEAAEREIASVREECGKLGAEKDKLSKDVMDVNKVLVAKVAKLEEAVKENETIKTELESLKQANNTNRNVETEKQSLEKLTKSATDELSMVSIGDSFVSSASKASDLEDKVDKLTLQLEMVERQRKQVILENDKICEEREVMEGSMKKMQQDNEDLKLVIRGMEDKLKKLVAEQTTSYEEKVSAVKEKLKLSENKKLEFMQLNLESEERIKHLLDNILELKERLKEAHTITFQPVRYSLSLESQSSSSEFSNFVENVRLYDKTLKDLAQCLNHNSLLYVELFDKVTSWLREVNSNPQGSTSNLEERCKEIQTIISGHNMNICNSSQQIKTSLGFLEKLFLDYQQVLKINKDFEEKQSGSKDKLQVDDHLVAKVIHLEEEISKERKERQMLVDIVSTLQKESEERDLLRTQMEVYRTDFEAERESRTRIASEKEEILSTLQNLQKRNQTLVNEMNKMRAQNPMPSTSRSPPRPVVNNAIGDDDQPSPKFQCPICNHSLISMKMLQEHVETCLDTVGPE